MLFALLWNENLTAEKKLKAACSLWVKHMDQNRKRHHYFLMHYKKSRQSKRPYWCINRSHQKSIHIYRRITKENDILFIFTENPCLFFRLSYHHINKFFWCKSKYRILWSVQLQDWQKVLLLHTKRNLFPFSRLFNLL